MVIASALLCAACAGPVSRLPPLPKTEVEAERRSEQITQMRSYFAQRARVDAVVFRIRTANRADCKKRVAPQLGLLLASPKSLPRRYRDVAAEALHIGWEHPAVVSVVDGGPAAQAGIAAGDVVTALNGDLVPMAGTANWVARQLDKTGVTPVSIELRRDGADRLVSVTPVMGCSIPLDFITADEMNAYTDGRKIVVNSSILQAARTDAQLALVIGHELAHANLGHIGKRTVNSVVGMVGGAVVDGGLLLGGISTGGIFMKEFGRAGAGAYSVQFEREADYVGAYYAARAGYDLTGAEAVWRAFGETHPDSILFAKTHPSTPERFVQLQKVEAEIADKERRHLPLVPELATVPVAAADANENDRLSAH